MFSPHCIRVASYRSPFRPLAKSEFRRFINRLGGIADSHCKHCGPGPLSFMTVQTVRINLALRKTAAQRRTDRSARQAARFNKIQNQVKPVCIDKNLKARNVRTVRALVQGFKTDSTGAFG